MSPFNDLSTKQNSVTLFACSFLCIRKAPSCSHRKVLLRFLENISITVWFSCNIFHTSFECIISYFIYSYHIGQIMLRPRNRVVTFYFISSIKHGIRFGISFEVMKCPNNGLAVLPIGIIMINRKDIDFKFNTKLIIFYDV